MRWVLRLVALACLVLGVAYAGLINEIIDLHRQLHHVGLRRQLLSYGLSLFGFCIASLGFWTTASVVEAGAPTSEDETAEFSEVETTAR